MSAPRETILGRVAEALKLAAPPPRLSSESPAGASGKAARAWLPEGGETPEERLALLCGNLAKLGADFLRFPDEAAAARALAELALRRGWKRVAAHRSELLTAVLAPLGVERWDVEDGFDKWRLEGCDAGITTCRVLVAQTGSILVSSADNGGRAISVLPPIHIVVARAEQVVSDLTDALAQPRSPTGALPSMLSFITGPSRTGDIERILVIGAHGPKELLVILIG